MPTWSSSRHCRRNIQVCIHSQIYRFNMPYTKIQYKLQKCTFRCLLKVGRELQDFISFGKEFQARMELYTKEDWDLVRLYRGAARFTLWRVLWECMFAIDWNLFVEGRSIEGWVYLYTSEQRLSLYNSLIFRILLVLKRYQSRSKIF